MWSQACKLLLVDTGICAKQLAGSQLTLEIGCHMVNQIVRLMDPKI